MQTNWWENFFHGIALDFWRAAISDEQTRAEADFIKNQLRLPPGAKVLDVPCGNGRLSIELGAFGFELTGVDIAEEFIEEAKRDSRERALDIDWRKGDMRQLPWSEEFDGAFCFGNSFGYLDSNAAREFLSAIARTLKPGSRFAVETGMAAESIFPSVEKMRWYKVGDIYMLSENQYHPREGRLDIQYTFIRDGRVETRPTSSYVLTVNEICRMHVEAGLEPVELLGSIQGEPYQA